MIEQLLIVGLAGWRLAFLLVTEDGPFDVFERLRRRVGVPPRGEPFAIDGAAGLRHFVPQLFMCVFCMSFWQTGLALATWELVDPLPVLFIAAWGFASAIEHFRNR